MNKQRAIQIITRAAELYKNNLEDQKILFLYGIPSHVKKDLQTQTGYLPSINSYEVAFHRCNFLHLTGVKLNTNTVASSIHFYEKCIKKRLTENDFSLAKNGSTVQKLDVLENMMLLKKSITMNLQTKDHSSLQKKLQEIFVDVSVLYKIKKQNLMFLIHY